MEQVRPLTSLSTDELIARIEQYMVVVELRDAEIRELHAANSALLAERDALRDALQMMTYMVEQSAPLLKGKVYQNARAALAQDQEQS